MIIALWLILKVTQRKAYILENTYSEIQLEVEVGKNSLLARSLSLWSFLCCFLHWVVCWLSFQPICHSNRWIVCTSSRVNLEGGAGPFWWAEKFPQMINRWALESVAFQSCPNVVEYFTFRWIHLFNSHCSPGVRPCGTCAFGLVFIGFVLYFHPCLYTGT